MDNPEIVNGFRSPHDNERNSKTNHMLLFLLRIDLPLRKNHLPSLEIMIHQIPVVVAASVVVVVVVVVVVGVVVVVVVVAAVVVGSMIK